jgi:long-chain acyl-CoA synthetase
MYDKIKQKFAETTGCKKFLLDRGLASKSYYLHRDGTTRSGCYDKLIFNKISAMLGGNVRIMVTASAPIDKEVLNFLKVAFCCPIVEGYGLTEVSGGASVTATTDPVAGHVGGPLPCIKFRLKDVPEMEYLSTDKPYPRGEICMKGQTVFSGYFKRPDKTAEAFDEDGWFKTGDIGVVYPNGSVRIVDRSKNIFKLQQGEYVAPEKLENIFIQCPYIS